MCVFFPPSLSFWLLWKLSLSKKKKTSYVQIMLLRYWFAPNKCRVAWGASVDDQAMHRHSYTLHSSSLERFLPLPLCLHVSSFISHLALPSTGRHGKGAVKRKTWPCLWWQISGVGWASASFLGEKKKLACFQLQTEVSSSGEGGITLL